MALQKGLSRMHKNASASLRRSKTCRYSLPPKFSPAMHRQNIEDFKETKKYTRKLIYLADKAAYDAWNKKEAASWDNPESRNRALASIYGKTSLWGKIEEEERLRLEVRVCEERSDDAEKARLQDITLPTPILPYVTFATFSNVI